MHKKVLSKLGQTRTWLLIGLITTVLVIIAFIHPFAGYDLAFENQWGRYIADIYIPESDYPPVIIFAHGWIANKDIYSSFGEFLKEHGYAVVIFTVPSRFSLKPIQWSDGVSSAINYLEDSNLNIDLSRIGVAGHSMGGLATLIATSSDSRIKCAVSLSPAVLSRFNPPKKIDVPTQIQSGNRDWLIPLKTVEEYYNELNCPNKELVIIEGGHRLVPSNKNVGESMLNWLDHYL